MSSTMTAEVTTLLEIMNDRDVPTRRRIQCAEYLLSHESPPDAVTGAQEYLKTIFRNKEEDLDDRLNAIEISRKFATPRVTTSVVHLRENKDFIEQQRDSAIGRRKNILIAKGILPWHFPKDWDSDLRDPNWVPLTPEQIQIEEEEFRELQRKRRLNPEPVHVPNLPLAD